MTQEKLHKKSGAIYLKEQYEEKEMAEWLRIYVAKDDLISASKILPKDHPIRPALKRAISK